MSRWFFIFHALAVFLLASLFLPPTEELWRSFDTACFRILNESLIGHPVQQAFWAVANIKITDIFGASFLLCSFLLYIFEAEGNERRRRLAQLLYTLLWFEISIFACKQIYTPICESSGLSRHSPTLVLQNAFMLSEVVPWAKIKDSSYFCFPADHASIVFQWCAFLWYFAGWKRGASIFFCSLIFLLPRLISGAHWTSDLLVGSGSVVLIALAWALHTPLYERAMRLLYRLLTISEAARPAVQSREAAPKRLPPAEENPLPLSEEEDL